MNITELKVPLKTAINLLEQWSNDERAMKLLRAILRDLEAEPPKPTGEQLKAIGKILDGDAPREYAAGDRIWTELGMSRVLAGSETGRCRWHLKDAPETPALMICNHAGECKTKCGLKIPHLEVPECRIIRKMVYSTGCPFPDAVCVPWVEPVKHYSCDGCGGAILQGTCANCWDPSVRKDGSCLRRNYTPKEPEPAAKLNHHNFSSRPCSTCGWMKDGCCGCTIECHGDQWKARDTEGVPGLVPYPIIGGKGNELWLVQRPAGAIALYKAVGRTDFAYIETEIGDKFISMQAFDDPPVRAWFRKQ